MDKFDEKARELTRVHGWAVLIAQALRDVARETREEMLTQIRKHYPELESEVMSTDTASSQPGRSVTPPGVESTGKPLEQVRAEIRAELAGSGHECAAQTLDQLTLQVTVSLIAPFTATMPLHVLEEFHRRAVAGSEDTRLLDWLDAHIEYDNEDGRLLNGIEGWLRGSRSIRWAVRAAIEGEERK